ncbi:MAG TPA: metallophosphoesterase [Stellaceae bacterium]|nr:metallophosphoesterase [Stellaceae bacterium]
MQEGSIARRRLLKCMMWGSAGVLWTVNGGVPRPFQLDRAAQAAEPPAGEWGFVQISDSHIGFKLAPNPDPGATLREALALARAGAGTRPAFMIHTGDLSHLAKPEQFDAAAEIIKGAGLETWYVPGEHDVIGDGGKGFFARFGRAKGTAGWYSFDAGGVHFVGLVNVLDLAAGGQGRLGAAQIEWLEDDLKGKGASTPIVVFAHMPLWSIYPPWGWGTEDAAPALAYLKRFGSVTVLNGHIHQVMQKVEGTVTFRTAYSTAFPQAAPGTPGASPGPLKVPAEKLKSLLGLRRVDYAHDNGVTVADATLGA